VICIVDYGLGNVQAFANMYKRLGIEARLAKTAGDLADAKGVVLPGVGAFDRAVALLDRSGMRAQLTEIVVDRHVPTLGICVGMQLLADGSDEGAMPGLGWVPGRVRSFENDPASTDLPKPHMGWNDVRPMANCSPLFTGLESDARFYFLHSYYFECETTDDAIATAHYGLDFGCAVSRGNVYGVQFHPEKSHHWGAQLLKNFADIAHA
jgi:imidazole glycerol-phosphate synthase subunit HisH